MFTCPCGQPVPAAGRGRPRAYCSSPCRQKAYRARQRGESFPVPQPEPVPAALRDLPRWTRRDGKRPIRVSGAPASSTDPGTWAEFAAVQRGAGDGYGIMLGGGLGCYDFDHCLDGGRLVSPRVAEVLARLEPLYVEVSMSGDGLHAFVAMPEGPGTRLPWMETYSRARFIAVTGDRWEAP